MDAGHYIPKAGNSDALYFSEYNVHIQCQDCNRLKDGNTKEYRLRLIKKYGDGVILKLNLLRQAQPFTNQEYKELIIKYTALVKIINTRQQ
jgi:hypothetical protein